MDNFTIKKTENDMFFFDGKLQDLRTTLNIRKRAAESTPQEKFIAEILSIQLISLQDAINSVKKTLTTAKGCNTDEEFKSQIQNRIDEIAAEMEKEIDTIE